MSEASTTNKLQEESASSTVENILHPRFWFGEIDTRWVAVFRILLGLLILKDALYHLPLARIFYSDRGIVPRWELFNGLVRDRRFSLMDAFGQPWMVLLFFCVWIIVLVFLIAGYRVRLMAILNFIIILSVHERNAYILTSADTLMRAMSFWLIFAPIGQYYALDAIRRRWKVYRATGDNQQLHPAMETRTAFAFPVRLIQLQLVILYISTAYLKAIGPIWQDGEVMHYITQIETFILPAGVWMRSWSPEMLKLASYFSLYAEIAIPILLILPLMWRWSRLLAFILAILLHGGIAITLSIQDFSILMLICYLPFFAPEWLVWLENQFRKTIEKITLPRPADENSPLWMWFSLLPAEKLIPGQETQSADNFDDWKIEIDSESMTGKDAWKTLTGQLAFAPFWHWLFNFGFVRRFTWWLMGIVVKGYQTRHYVDKTLTRQKWLVQRTALASVLVPLFILVILFNIQATLRYKDNDFRYPRPVQILWSDAQDIVWYTGLWQYWDMFSPTPIQYDGWLIIEAQFEDGESYDLVTGEAVDYGTPTRWYWGPDMKWEKFEENVFQGRHDPLLRGWGSYYCNTINEGREYGTRLATLEITMAYRNFYAPGEFQNPQQTDQLWFHWCFDEFAPQS